MSSNITRDNLKDSPPSDYPGVIKERTVTTSLLGYIKKWYGVEDAREIQEMCEGSEG